MVKVKQKNLKIFEFQESTPQELIAYLEKNAPLLRGFLLLFPFKIAKELADFLQKEGFLFFDSTANISPRTKESETRVHETPPQADKTESEESELPREKTQIFQRTIRSGEDILAKGDVIIFGRINSGARIQSEGNAQIFGEIDGVVECRGESILLGKIAQGSVLFGGEILDPACFCGPLKQAWLQEGSVMIKEVG